MGLQLILEGLVFGIEVGVGRHLRVAGCELGLLCAYLLLEQGYLLLLALHLAAQLAQLALAFFRLLVLLFALRRGGRGRGLAALLGHFQCFQMLYLAEIEELEDVALELMDAAVAELEQRVGQTLKEVAVVRHHDERARVLQECML